ncbi:CU044_5270 family protein [Herbidospora sp. NBRC 101105]|uniref:CU044_5270 family protein n=1 Tax=Herbidospora sp. NBRC 101105 TaxID=3032195 RepID=UPI0024A295E5|nr:CU044_5270 family protein [Herbidospora sp. NBRC 101105]GLX96528.1 hypothetical protein Hesp01_44780 [Herbidospora sp. NBRC 101105]
MNEMTEIRRLWDDVPEGTPADLAPSRARLLTEIDGRRRPRRLLLRVALVTAGAVAAVQIGVGLTDTGPPENAADLLERAALAAAEQPDLTPGPGQYVHTEMRTLRMTTQLGPGSQARQLSIPYREERWEPADAGRPWLLRERSLDPMWDQGVNDTVHTTSCDSAGTLTLARLAHWPTDPAALRPLVEREAAKATAIPARERLWHTTARLIRESAFRPPLTAALYRLAADLPGITLTERAADALGRPGVAVSFRYDGLRSELVFDRDTYRFLGSRTVTTEERTKRMEMPKSTPERIEEVTATMVKFGDTPEKARERAEEMRQDREFVVTTPNGVVTDAFAIVGIGLADAHPPLAEKVSHVTLPC